MPLRFYYVAHFIHPGPLGRRSSKQIVDVLLATHGIGFASLRHQSAPCPCPCSMHGDDTLCSQYQYNVIVYYYRSLSIRIWFIVKFYENLLTLRTAPGTGERSERPSRCWEFHISVTMYAMCALASVAVRARSLATTKEPPSTAAHSDARSVKIAKYLVNYPTTVRQPNSDGAGPSQIIFRAFRITFSFAHHSASCATCVRATQNASAWLMHAMLNETRASDDWRDSVSSLTLNVDASTTSWKRIPCSEKTFRWKRIFRRTQSRHSRQTTLFSSSNRKHSLLSRPKSCPKSIWISSKIPIRKTCCQGLRIAVPQSYTRISTRHTPHSNRPAAVAPSTARCATLLHFHLLLSMHWRVMRCDAVCGVCVQLPYAALRLRLRVRGTHRKQTLNGIQSATAGLSRKNSVLCCWGSLQFCASKSGWVYFDATRSDSCRSK